jgi:hypothetical protein
MTLNERQKQGLKQLEISLMRCSSEEIKDTFVLDFIADYFAVKKLKVFYKELENKNGR